MVTLYTRDGREQVQTTTINGAPAYSYQTSCSRCGGAGGAEKWRYTGWKCFECGGSGKGPVCTDRLYTAEKLAQLNAVRDKRNAKKAAAAQAKQDAITAECDARRAEFLARNAEFLTRLAGLGNAEFFATMHAQMIERASDPTARQIEVVDAEYARRAQRAASGFVGSLDARIEITVTTERVLDITPANQPYGFGRRFMFLARDTAGNRIVYKGSGRFPNEGETATVKATVAEHTEYRGEKQTIVQRPKVVGVGA